MATPTRLETNESAAITVVRFKDQKIIDPEAIQELGQELFDLIDKEERRKIVLNFSRVEFLSRKCEDSVKSGEIGWTGVAVRSSLPVRFCSVRKCA